jgi:hypothetical protein
LKSLQPLETVIGNFTSGAISSNLIKAELMSFLHL